MNSLCRVCLASHESFKFASIFDNGGKNATEIFLLSGLRVRLFSKLIWLLNIYCFMSQIVDDALDERTR